MTQLSPEKHFSKWSDGALVAFDQVQVLDVRGQQIDFNFATSYQKMYMKEVN